MTKDQAATIARAMFPQGLRVLDLPPEGRQELRDGMDALLAAWAAERGDERSGDHAEGFDREAGSGYVHSDPARGNPPLCAYLED